MIRTVLWFVLVGMCHWKFESGPIHKPIFKEKVNHSYTNQLNFGSNFDQNYHIFKINLDSNILKILKNQHIHKPNSVWNDGSLIYLVADFAIHICSTYLYMVFCIEYPLSYLQFNYYLPVSFKYIQPSVFFLKLAIIISVLHIECCRLGYDSFNSQT